MCSRLCRWPAGAALVSVAVLSWSLLPIGLKCLTTSLATDQIVFARFLVAVLVMAPFALGPAGRRREHLTIIRKHWRPLLALAAVGIVFPQLLFTWSIRHLPAGVASFLGFSHPVFSMLFAAAFLRERRLGRWGLFVTTLLLAMGLGLLAVRDPVTLLEGGNNGWLSSPALLGLAVPLLWGLSSLLAKVLLRDQIAPPMVIAWWRVAAGTMFVGLVVAARGGFDASFVEGLDGNSVMWLLVLGVFSVAIGVSAYFAGLERVSLTTASALEACVAPLGAFIAVVFLPEEHLLWHQWLGGGVVFLAALLPIVLPRLRRAGRSAGVVQREMGGGD